MGTLHKYTFVIAAAALLATGCGDDATGGADMGASGGDMATGSDNCNLPAYQENVSSCMHVQTDYEPRVNMSAGDPWAACISDDNTFHLVGTSTPPSAARTAAFEDMAKKLWKNPNAPAVKDFDDARLAYAVSEGIGSRVARRQDVSYPEIPGDNKLKCSDAGVAMMYPDRCAGPMKILPILNDAFTKGAAQDRPRVQAARIEAALLWFFYLSTTSEVWTCGIDDIVDCDAAWGYFNGAQPRATPLGLGAYFKAQGQETYDRGFDGILAERCWRDLDKALPLTDMTHYLQALAQLAKAELRGMALILRERIAHIPCSTGDVQEGHMQFVAILGGFLDHAARAIDAAKADQLKMQWSATDPGKVDVKAAQDLIDALFPCP